MKAQTARWEMKRAVLRANAALGRYRRVIWLIGEGRSGTTWVASVINADGAFREMFEPFHPGRVPTFAGHELLEYRAPGQADEALEARLAEVFSGRLTHPRVDAGNHRLIYRGLIVKDIFATLLVRWALDRFPFLEPLLIIRNPFAVARSKYRMSSSHWLERPSDLLSRSGLADDHLGEQRRWLSEEVDRASPIVRHIAVWAVVHHVLARQFSGRFPPTVFYEDLVAGRSEVLATLAAARGGDAGADIQIRAADHSGNRVSSAADVASARADPYGAWRTGLSDEEIAAGLDVLRRFGLDRLYGLDGRPNPAVLLARPLGCSVA